LLEPLMCWVAGDRFELGGSSVDQAGHRAVFGISRGGDAHRRIPVGVEGSASGIRAKVGAKAASLAELAVALPVQIIDSEIHYLI
jgi:hypothetical protein